MNSLQFLLLFIVLCIMFSSESYGGGHHHPKRLSRSELQKIKKNMKKVPIIQEKSAQYHAGEAEQAEELLEGVLSIKSNETSNLERKDHEIPWYVKILNKVKALLGQ